MTLSTTGCIRAAAAADAERIAALVERAYSKWIAVIGRRPKPMLADYSKAVADHLVYVVEGEGDALAGVIELVPGPDHMLIENVAVDPARQGQGLGKILLGFGETIARKRGLSCMRLYTNALMRANVALYERQGYVETERRHNEKLDTTVVYMTKRLG